MRELNLDHLRTLVTVADLGTLSAASQALHLPVAVLHREISAGGLNFKSLVEDVRRDLAISYLGQRQLPLSEIALLLGYSELSAFSRAFRRWTGRSPRSFRKSGSPNQA